MRILCVRLGAMGDIVHALPAVASLRAGFPSARITWLVEPRWMPLLESNPDLNEVMPFERGSFEGLWRTMRALRTRRFDLAVDFQGLIKSSLAAWISGARVEGFLDPRERPAAWLYAARHGSGSRHIVDRNLDLASASGAKERVMRFAIPPGRLESDLPPGPFVLANPFAGWGSKQWPLERYAELADWLRTSLGLPLVVNGPPDMADRLRQVRGAWVHLSGIAGLIDATRRAAAVVGVDSGPTHLAAALDTPGVAVFGPTDPARNGPYGASFTVIRAPGHETSYKRGSEPTAGMRRVTAAEAGQALERRMARVCRG